MQTNNPEQTIELPARITHALAAIGYQVVMPPVAESECEDCDGLGYDPEADGWQTCPICQGWRSCRWLLAAAPVNVSPGNPSTGLRMHT